MGKVDAGLEERANMELWGSMLIEVGLTKPGTWFSTFKCPESSLNLK